jgi:FixJ family two-component response regulator
MSLNDGQAASDGHAASDEVQILLASGRSWLASSMRAVLEPEGYRIRHTESVAQVLREAERRPPGVVIIDEGIPDCSVPELCGALFERALPRSVPILVYSAAFWDEAEETAAMRAGAWDIIREPIRSRLLVEKLRRLIQIRRLIEAAEEGAIAEDAAGTLTLGGLFRVLGILGSLAHRQGVGIGCAVLGPTAPATDRERLAGQRSSTAELVALHTRGSDVCAWVGDADLALIAYGTATDGVRSILRRLSRVEVARTSDGAIPGAPVEVLSAGITALDPETFQVGGGQSADAAADRSPGDQVASLGQIAQAQAALRKAREAGGGVRAADEH